MPKKTFPHQTAGSRLISAFPKAKVGDTIATIEQMLTKKANDFETIDYVYVIDKDNVLQGVISIKETQSSKKGFLV